MVTYYFKCKGCKAEFEKFKMGLENLALWKADKLEVKCPTCGSTSVDVHLPKGSGQFQSLSHN